MTCKFQEHKAKYICTAERVMEADDVLDAIMADFKVQEEFFASPYPTTHLIPLSHRFVVSTYQTTRVDLVMRSNTETEKK